ncbi:MAG: Na+/H+ antiporter subunit E [Candidatus Izemoplasmatales bacterium]|jgi:multicomponent Na+:H+ antiporter subunit E|nr:Na+/H+ antiporter subunit E [Candidatus Izemoplasmatales bacterium]
MKYLATFIVLFVIYLFLAGFVLEEVVLGSIVSATLTLILVKFVNFKIDLLLPIKLLKFVFIYLPVFIWKLILANFDVARRVLSPKIPLNPGIVRIKTDLKGDFGKLTLANSITLTPGTLSIDIDEDYLYVHTVDVIGKNEAENKKAISESFEKILGGIFK